MDGTGGGSSRRSVLGLFAAALSTGGLRRETTGAFETEDVRVTVAVAPGADIESRVLRVAGRVRRPERVDRVRVTTPDGRIRTFRGPDFPAFRAECPLSEAGGRRRVPVEVYERDGTGRRSTLLTRRVLPGRSPPATDRLVGAHYYPWYGTEQIRWTSAEGRPLLGGYDSTDQIVVDQHLQWAYQHGVDWLSVSWWGPGTETDAAFRERLLGSRFADAVSTSVLYEAPGRLDADGAGPLDFDDEATVRTFVDDVGYLAESYFDHPSYLTVDGRPVLFLYKSREFRGDVSGAVERASEAAGTDLYLIGDEVGWRPPDASAFAPYDAVAPYTMYTTDPPGPSSLAEVEGDFADHVREHYRRWRLAAEAAGVDFVPMAMPGFDDRSVRPGESHPVLTRSTGRFRRLSAAAAETVDPGVDAALVTSFNEWPEGTRIEPGRRDGGDYLQVVPRVLAADRDAFDPSEHVPVRLDFSTTVPERTLVDGRADRDLAFRCFRLAVRDGGRTVRDYDVGALTEEPLFTAGVYLPAGTRSRRWRWFGGAAGRTVFYLDRATADAGTRLAVTGRPVDGRDDIRVTISVGGRTTDSLSLGDLRSRGASLGG